MVGFDDLPHTTRSLLLATLNLEIMSADCANIFDLARKRNQSVSEVWRDICRKSGQVRCPIPPQLLATRYTADGPAAFPAAASPAPVVPPSPASIRAPHVAARSPVSHAKMEHAHIAATAAPAQAATPAQRGQHAQNRLVKAAAALGGVVVVGAGLYLLTAALTSTTSTRPTETVRIDVAKPGSDKEVTANVPAPQGTIRRMDAISKSFSKK